MPFPISELIDQNMLTTLQGVTTPAYQTRLSPERRKKNANASATADGSLKTILHVFPDAPIDDAPNEEHPRVPMFHQQFMRRYWVQIYIYQSEGDNTPYDQLVNIARADVEKAIMVDRYRGTNPTTHNSLAIDTFVRDPLEFSEGTDAGGVIVQVDVEYRTLEGDPYSQ
jgi:hypothetical protein